MIVVVSFVSVCNLRICLISPLIKAFHWRVYSALVPIFKGNVILIASMLMS